MTKLSKKQQADVDALINLPDDQIDTVDIPEFTFTHKAEFGKFYRPTKKAISFRVDLDVLSWLKQSGPGYQGRMNDILRREMITANQVKSVKRKRPE